MTTIYGFFLENSTEFGDNFRLTRELASTLMHDHALFMATNDDVQTLPKKLVLMKTELDFSDLNVFMQLINHGPGAILKKRIPVATLVLSELAPVA